MERVLLVGSDDVICGGRMMQSAASDMQRAAGEISSALQQHQQFMQQWLYDLKEVLETKK